MKKFNILSVFIAVGVIPFAYADVKSPSHQSLLSKHYKVSETFANEGLSEHSGNQSSADISGILNCDNFIVHRKTLDIQECANPFQNSSYKEENKKPKSSYIIRYAGLNKTLSGLPQIEKRTAQKGRYANSNTRDGSDTAVSQQGRFEYRSNMKGLEGYDISRECIFTGNSRVSDYDLRQMMKNRSDNHNFHWKKASTSSQHQVLPVNFEAPISVSGCYDPCQEYPLWKGLNGQLHDQAPFVEVLECARGEGQYIRRYRVKYEDPAPAIYNQISNNLYLDPADCKTLDKYAKRDYRNGIDDINNCYVKNTDNVSVYNYYNDIAWNDELREHFNTQLGGNISKTNTHQLLKSSIFVQADATNLTEIKFLNPTHGELKKVYTNLFNLENIKDIEKVVIAFTKAGRDVAHSTGATQFVNGQSIHDFYEQGAVNYNNTNSNASAVLSNKNVLQYHTNYGSNMSYGIGFLNRSQVDTRTFEMKKTQTLIEAENEGDSPLEFQKEQLEADFISAFVPQKTLNALGDQCPRVGVRIDTFKHFIDRNERQTFICKDESGKLDKEIQLGSGIDEFTEAGNYRGFEFSSIDWRSTIDSIDITDKVKDGQIPYIYYLNNEDRQMRGFIVHFIVSYKQDPGMLNIPRLRNVIDTVPQSDPNLYDRPTSNPPAPTQP